MIIFSRAQKADTNLTGSQDFSPDNGPTCLESRLFDLRYAPFPILISPYLKKKRNNSKIFRILTTINIIHIQFHYYRCMKKSSIFIFIFIISILFRLINSRNKSSLLSRSKTTNLIHSSTSFTKISFNLPSSFSKKKTSTCSSYSKRIRLEESSERTWSWKLNSQREKLEEGPRLNMDHPV